MCVKLTKLSCNSVLVNTLHFKKLIEDALLEDIGMGDITTQSVFSETETSTGTYTCKAELGVIAGLEALSLTYELLGGNVNIDLHKKDGDLLTKGDVVATVTGPVRTLLTGERVILNLVQHMSGIASSTRELVDLLDDDSIAVVDTRKTLPGLRSLQKFAVTCGGGKNHRFRLDDGAMVKDNHIKAAGSISKAVKMIREKAGHMVRIEVETESEAQVLEAVAANADVIMLDNRSPEEVKELVSLIPNHIISEVSGGITPANIATYRGCGANIISVGWITHSVKALDISFNLDVEK